MASNVGTDYHERAAITTDAHGDVVLSLYRLVRPEEGHRDGWDRTDEIVLRPSQAERLAAELLAYANGDHKLPRDAVRPQRIVVGPPTPAAADDEADEFVTHSQIAARHGDASD